MRERHIYPNNNFVRLVFAGVVLIFGLCFLFANESSLFERWIIYLCGVPLICYLFLLIFVRRFLDERGLVEGCFWKGRLLKETKRVNFDDVKAVMFIGAGVTVWVCSTSIGKWSYWTGRGAIRIPVKCITHWKSLLMELLAKVPHEKVDHRVYGLLLGTEFTFLQTGQSHPISKRYEKAVELFCKGEFEKAISVLCKILKVSPSRFNVGRLAAYQTMVESYFMLEQNEQAHSVARDAASFAPQNPVAHQLMGVTFAAIGEMDQAMEYMQKARAGYLDVFDKGSADNCETLMGVFPLKNDRSELLRIVSQGLENDPREIHILCEVARIFEQEKRWGDAESFYLEAQKRNPDSKVFIDLYLKRLEKKREQDAAYQK